jgi:hypothetical protein
LPPVQQGRELHSLDATVNPEAQKQTIEVRFDGPAGHFELARDLGVIATL